MTLISKKTGMPISTVYDRLKKFGDTLIKKHTSIVDFSELGYNTRANLVLKVGKNQRGEVADYLKKHHVVNTLYKINNGYDFLAEVIFRDMKGLQDFLEELEEKFSLKSKQVYYTIEDIKREDFISKPEIQDWML